MAIARDVGRSGPVSRIAIPLLCAGCAAWGGSGGAPSLNVRLSTPLTSYGSHAGSQFRAVVIAPYELDEQIVLPPGTVVYGAVRRTKGIGMGVVRERASMDLDFQEYELADGRRFPFRATLLSIDNARETVSGEGRIQGILAAGGPQNFVGGFWRRPSLGLFSRSFLGLTGASGRIFTAYSMGPAGGAVLFAIRCAIFRLPEPEIRLPAGTEMKLAVTELAVDAPTFARSTPAIIPEELSEWLVGQPAQVARADGNTAPDIINVAFIGSREQLADAFRAAGWFQAEPLTGRSFSRAYRAYTMQKGYAAAPMSRLAYRSAAPDAEFEKSFNTVSKRDHIRIWRVPLEGGEVWLGAATHDAGVRFNSGMGLTHRIYRRIDSERTKVVRDLEFAGCVEPVRLLERPPVAAAEAKAGEIFTDGRLAALVLRNGCTGPADTFSPLLPRPPNSRAARIVRRMMLEGRQYMLRGNGYYWAYRAFAFQRARSRHTLEGEE